jgi:hypothetical protein
MTHSPDIPLCEPLDPFDWDPSEIRDLIQSAPTRFHDDSSSAGYDAEQLFSLEAAYAE